MQKNSIIKKAILPKDQTFTIPNQNIFGLKKKETEQVPYIVLKYYQPNYQCFSEWNKQELKGFSDFIEKLRKTNWNLIKQQSSAKNKVGFGYTQIDKKILPNASILNDISEDVSFAELRLSKESRIFGFRINAAFFLIFLDKNHEICS